MSVRESFKYFWVGFVQWLKDHTTADALTDGVKTAVWVVPLTILIWIYAEQEQPTQGNEQTVLINVRSADPERVVTVLNPHDAVPIITMNGPRSAIEAAKKALDQVGDTRLITVEVPSSLKPGPSRDVYIKSDIERAPIFKKYGVVVTDVRPATISVRIDPIGYYDLPVVAPPSANLDGPATFEPKTVKIRAPQQTFDDAKLKSGDPVAVAQIPTTGDLAKPGSHDDVKLPVKLPATLEADNVTPVSSLNVVANYKIKASSVPGEIGSLNVHVQYGTINMADQIQVSLPSPFLKHVQISGPKEKVDRVINNALTNQDPIPYAVVSIDQKDVDDITSPGSTRTSKTLTKKLSYFLGDPDVICTEENTRTIEVQITKRAG